jgi:hypothetical protein
MKRVFIYLLIVIPAFLLSSCEDYLDKKESATLTAEQVFGDPVQFQKFHDDIYTYLHYWPGDWACQSFGGLGRIGYSSFEGATDLAEASRDVAGTNAGFNLGNWSTGAYGMQVELKWPWTGSYAAIRRCNVVLEKVDGVPGFTAAKVSSLKSEALFLRAFFYSELIKRYGGVPYLTKSLNVTDSMDFAREPYDTCVQKIVRDLDAALPSLPNKSEQATTDLGRPTKVAAMALKAKVLLYDASPLNTEPYDVSIGDRNPDLYFVETPNTPAEIQTKWEKAARAAYDVIETAETLNGKNKYSLLPFKNYTDIFYGEPATTSTEVIYCRVDGSWSFSGGKAITGWISFADYGASKGYGGSAGTYPTQNFVDMFEMADGTIPILGYENGDVTKPIINPASGYTEQTMWQNRDPRLKKIVLCNQDKWQDRAVEMWFDKTNPSVSGSEMKDARDYCTTGYLCKKMWPEDLKPGGTANVFMNWIWIRYADVLLWYAEAMNHAYGPDVDGLGNGRTARWALNEVRTRAGMPGVVATTKEKFHERLMNERAIEFVYEEQRWWDVIRYKKGVETFGTPIYGVRSLRTSTSPLIFEITRRKLENRTFNNYMHVYPIPYTELEKSPKLKQNLGW